MSLTRRVFVVDDHAVTRKGYVFLIGEEPGLEVCGEAESAEHALATLPDDCDVVVTDVSMDGMNGVELVKSLQAARPELPVLVVSMHDESLYAERVLKAGARGYLMKSEAGDQIVEAVRRVLRGGTYVSPSMAEAIVRQFSGGAAATPETGVDALSDRELEALEHLGRGLKTSEIARAMVVSPNTVESYRARIKKKLGLASGGDLTRYAIRHAQERGLM
ncbi:response regulator transcription factor [Rubrivirga litoralis]|uniref:Response regulator transcription factor n=1 Tax=Rubrivirga litoralis TaxID=3075598 RepID=A0ABU3BRM8_9BACT|nr:response regulator transcription factor [Rubrivirga sp. F394]MDT0631929.1 response regulator transcription factor [Rubrivirga sp. F394]